MVQGVGPTGSGGSIRDLSAYQTYYPMYEQYCKTNKNNLSFEAWLRMKGYYTNFSNQVENYLETGNQTRGNENEDTLNTNRHISNGTGAIYQSEDEETIYQFDWEDGTYKTITGKDEIAKTLGLPSSENIDTVKLGYMNAQIVDYTFGNLDDGQDRTTQDVYGNYANVTYDKQEFDIHYILNALLMDPTDPQYQIAKGIFDELCASTSQWLPDSDMEELDAVAQQYGTNSAEYKAKLQEILLKNLDQANEWIEDHTHVKNPNSVGQVGATEQVDGTTGTNTEESTNPTADVAGSYDKNDVLYNTSLYSAYTTNETSTCSSYGKKDDVINEGKTNFANDARAKLEEVGNALKSQLQSSMGENYDSAVIDEYVQKAIQSTIDHFLSDIPTTSKNNGHGGTYNADEDAYTVEFIRKTRRKGRIGYSNKNLIDYFFNEFDSLCTNNGKTAEEAAAEKAAAEKKAAQEKSAYQTLYNMQMSSLANEAGVNKDIQVVNVSSAADIQAEAENKILAPIMEKIKSKLAGKGIPDSDLQTVLDNAASAALADCTQWATTSNNYVYTIDTSELVSRFENNVKTIIKNKGYDF